MQKPLHTNETEPIAAERRPRPWVLFAGFALVLCWALFREWPLMTPIASTCLGGLLVHVARVVAEGRPQVIEYLVMTAGIALLLCGPNQWMVQYPPPDANGWRLLFSLAGMTVIGGPLVAANIAWLGLLITGIWTSFRDSGRLTPAALAAISVVSSGLFYWASLPRRFKTPEALADAPRRAYTAQSAVVEPCRSLCAQKKRVLARRDKNPPSLAVRMRVTCVARSGDPQP